MDLDVKLFKLCEDFICMLERFKEESMISGEEFENMTEYKLKFIEEMKDSLCLKY